MLALFVLVGLHEIVNNIKKQWAKMDLRRKNTIFVFLFKTTHQPTKNNKYECNKYLFETARFGD